MAVVLEEEPTSRAIRLEYDGYRLANAGDVRMILGDVRIPTIETNVRHGEVVCKHRSISVMQSGDRAIPTIGLRDALATLANENCHIVRGVDSQPPPFDVEPPLENSAVHNFVYRNATGLIKLTDARQVRLMASTLSATFPGQRIGFLASRFGLVQSCFRQTQNDVRSQQIHQRTKLFLCGRGHVDRPRDNQEVAHVFGTFHSVDADWLSHCGMIVLLDAVDVTHRRAIDCLAFSTDLRAKLFGLLRTDRRQLSASAMARLRCAYGFNELEFGRDGGLRRDCVLRLHPVHDGNGINCQSNRTYNQLIEANHRRNQIVRSTVLRLIRQPEVELGGRVHGFSCRPLLPQQVSVLVNTLRHGLRLSRLLNDCPIVTGSPVPHPMFRQLSAPNRHHIARHQIDRATSTDAIQIFTPSGAVSNPEFKPDGVVYAGGAAAMPHTITPWMFAPEPEHRPLAIVDFDDRFHPQAARWSNDRRQAWSSLDIPVLGKTAKQFRIEKFLQSFHHQRGDR